MSENTTGGYNRYITDLFATEDELLRSCQAEMARAGLPQINISASEGKLLHLLALMAGARRILEIGTLGGYSAIWLARALPADGRMVSLELDSHHADVARRNLAHAGLAGKVEVRVGPALQSLAQIAAAGDEPFDLVFIDADKDAYVAYLDATVHLVRKGGFILADNTLPDAVLRAGADSGTKRYNATVAARKDLVTTIVPVLRAEGMDGLTISIKQ